jgi:hypothetical protein
MNQLLDTLSEAWHVFSDPAHVLAETWSTLVEVAIIAPIVVRLNNKWHARHDKDKHGNAISG